MTEKHHPASSAGARRRVERAMRREMNAKFKRKKQSAVNRRFTEPTGFKRGARIKAYDSENEG